MNKSTNKPRDDLSQDEKGRNPANNMAAPHRHISKAKRNIEPPLMRRHNKVHGDPQNVETFRAVATQSRLKLFTNRPFFSRLVQIENICRRQIKCTSKLEICFMKGRKYCGKGEMLAASIFSFSYNVFKSLLSQDR